MYCQCISNKTKAMRHLAVQVVISNLSQQYLLTLRTPLVTISPHAGQSLATTSPLLNTIKIDRLKILQIHRQIGLQMFRKIEICQINQNYSNRIRKVRNSRGKNWSRHQLLEQKRKVFSKIHYKITTLWWYLVSLRLEWVFEAKNWRDLWWRKHRVRTNWRVAITIRVNKSSMKLWSRLLSAAYKRNFAYKIKTPPLTILPSQAYNSQQVKSPIQPQLPHSNCRHKIEAKMFKVQTICPKISRKLIAIFLLKDKRRSKRAVKSLHRIFSPVKCQTNLVSNQAIRITQLRGCPRQVGLRAPNKHCTWEAHNHLYQRLRLPQPKPISITIVHKLPISFSRSNIVKANWLNNSALQRLSNSSKPREFSLLAQLLGNY